jgi:hypothetical protein
MTEAVGQQYLVMYSQMTNEGLTMQPVDAHFETLADAEAVARRYGQWQIMEIAARVVKTSEDTK